MEPIRLQRFLSQAGVSARRKAEVLIQEGRVRVNGRVVTELGVRVDPSKDEIYVDDVRVLVEDRIYLVLNKPKGYVTTVSDPQGRPTVMDLIPQIDVKVAPVGRLDYYTEGVLLFTNDGELHSALLSPHSHVEKTYHAKLRGEVDMKIVEKLRKGVPLGEGRKSRPAQVDILKHTGKNSWLVITIREGQSRQIHRMAEAVGCQVTKLARVSFGGIAYFGLKVGETRSLTAAEVRDLRQLAGLAADEPGVARRVGKEGPSWKRPPRKPGKRLGKPEMPERPAGGVKRVVSVKMDPRKGARPETGDRRPATAARRAEGGRPTGGGRPTHGARPSGGRPGGGRPSGGRPSGGGKRGRPPRVRST